MLVDTAILTVVKLIGCVIVTVLEVGTVMFIDPLEQSVIWQMSIVEDEEGEDGEGKLDGDVKGGGGRGGGGIGIGLGNGEGN